MHDTCHMPHIKIRHNANAAYIMCDLTCSHQRSKFMAHNTWDSTYILLRGLAYQIRHAEASGGALFL